MDLTKTATSVGSALGIRQLLRNAQAFELNDALGFADLERRPSTLTRILPMVGLVTVSAAVGALAALLLAPSSGRKLRAKLAHELEGAKLRLNDRAGQLRSTPNGHAPS